MSTPNGNEPALDGLEESIRACIRWEAGRHGPERELESLLECWEYALDLRRSNGKAKGVPEHVLFFLLEMARDELDRGVREDFGDPGGSGAAWAWVGDRLVISLPSIAWADEPGGEFIIADRPPTPALDAEFLARLIEEHAPMFEVDDGDDLVSIEIDDLNGPEGDRWLVRHGYRGREWIDGPQFSTKAEALKFCWALPPFESRVFPKGDAKAKPARPRRAAKPRSATPKSPEVANVG